jgi:chemotaxis protein histidine kinase CheA
LWSCLLKYLSPVEYKPVHGSSGKKEDDDLQRIIKTNFVKYNQTVYDDFIKALDSGDVKQAHRIAHTLKGNAGQLGETCLQRAAAEIENLLRTGRNMLPKEHLYILKQELTTVLTKLESFNVVEEAAPAEEFNLEKAKEIVKILKPMLKSGNPESLNYKKDLRSIPGSEELIRLIDDFEFEAAAKLLVKITEGWN